MHELLLPTVNCHHEVPRRRCRKSLRCKKVYIYIYQKISYVNIQEYIYSPECILTIIYMVVKITVMVGRQCQKIHLFIR